MPASGHHATLFIGSREEGERFVLELLESEGIDLANNPDIHFFRSETLGIDEARKLRERASNRPFGRTAVFVILSEHIGREAQNALLKTIEEPSADTRFFIVAAHEELLLPTLRSRMQSVRTLHLEAVATVSAGIKTKVDKLSPEAFLSLPVGKRVAFAKKFVDAEKPLGPFLDALLLLLRDTVAPQAIKQIFTLRRYADDPSVNARMIIEHLAFLV